MEVKDAIKIIKSALADVQSTGQAFVHIPSLNTFLDNLEKNASVSSQILELQHQSNLEGYKSQRQQQIEMFRTVIATGQSALKTSLLINGGAAVALLAFMGRAWSKSLGNALYYPMVNSLSHSLVSFGVGVFIGALASGTTYLTQTAYNHQYNKTGISLQILTVLLVLATYCLFLSGMLNAGNAFLR